MAFRDRLIPNWKTIALRSHSMRAFYLGLICLLAPDAIYLFFSIDTNPRVWATCAFVLFVYGIFGRLLRQGIDETTLRSPWAVGVFVIFAVFAFATADWRARDVAPPPPVPVAADVLPVSDAKFAAIAVPFIGRWEGLRLTAYQDIVGVWTVCYGETKGVRPGDAYTRDECDAMLAREVIAYRADLHPAFSAKARADHLIPPRDLAFTSLAYNVGVSAARRSTAVSRLNAGDIRGACQALTWWNKAGGRVIRGLVNRRSEERDLCLQGLA